jgi:5-methylcytosine-specific restriction endonuclease McrA
MNVLNQKVVSLNRLWQVIGETSVKAAVLQLVGEAAVAIYINDGQMIPMKWSEWVKLPVNEEDGCIRSQRLRVRRPTVIAMCVYDKFKHKAPKANLKTLAALANYKDEYTGEKLDDPHSWSKDHINPVSKGGADKPENWAFTHKLHNNKKGSKTPEEMGWKRPKGHKLKPMPPSAFVTPAHPDHLLFLKK